MRFSLRTFDLGVVLFSVAVVGCGGGDFPGVTSAATGSGGSGGGIAQGSTGSNASGSSGGSGVGGMGSDTATTGTGANATGTGGSGVAASGTGGAGVCVPLTQTACYAGPPGTEGVGACKSGLATCLADGS